MSYDPGTADTSTIRPLAPGQWAIDSFRSNSSYIVTLGDCPSCTCPQWTMRCAGTDKQCKHQVAVIEHVQQQARKERYEKLTLLAGTVEDAELARLIEKYRALPGKGEVLLALLGEAFDREQLQPVPLPTFPALERVLARARSWGREQQDARLKAVFA